MRRLLPHGWLDLLRQVALFAVAYMGYRLVRGAVVQDAGAAIEHARHLIHVEQSLGVYTERAIYAWTASKEWLMDVAAWMYVNSHFTVTTAALAFMYLRRNPSFYFVRNMFVVSMALALVLYVVYPTAPPRLMGGMGFGDPVAHATGVHADDARSGLLFNPYAAVPSMHVAFALMVGAPLASMARRRVARVLWLLYPLIVTYVVIATANHWWSDVAAGVAVAATSAVAARALAAWRPQAWAFRPATVR